VVWEARDRAQGRACCIKFLLPEHARGFSLVRFKREFRTASRLSHPACVDVYDLDHADGLWFFSMELIAGSSLRDARGLRGDVRAVAAVGLQILAALDELHSKAIVHRDLKPHNILVAHAAVANAAPVAKLTDFGIAKVGDLDDDESVRSLRGSPPYLAPELLLEGVADARCDLYGLGVALYQTLTGRHPLGLPRQGTSWMNHIRTSDPIPLTTVAPDIPGEVADVLMRLCAKDPRVRFRSAAQGYATLADWLARQPEVSLPSLPALTGGPYLAAPRLIGRDRERVLVEEFLAGNLAAGPARSTAPPLLILSGAAGVGKSRLVSWLLRSAEQHSPAIRTGQCRSEIGAPFECLAPILRGLAGVPVAENAATAGRLAPHAGPGRTPGRISGRTKDDHDGETAAQTRTAGHDTPPSTAPPAPSESAVPDLSSLSLDDARSHRGQGLRQLLTSLTDRLLRAVEGRPTLIVIEDLQWGDFETLELLKLWTRSIAVDRAEGRALPVAVVITHRPVDDTDPLRALATELGGEGRALSLELEPLPPAAGVELAAELLMCSADDALADACRRLWGQQAHTPLYISQVLRLLIARGLLTRPGHTWDGEWDFARLPPDVQRLIPGTVEEAIGERASRLSIETKALLSLAAVFGRRFALAPLSQAAAIDSALARDCLDEAERAGFVSEPGGNQDDQRFAFTHDRFREALYRALPADQQRHLHGVVAATMLSRSPRKGRDVPADLALHFGRAGDGARAYRFSALAGEQAFQARQYSRASELYFAAIQHADALGKPPSHRLLCRLGDAASLALHADRAEQAYQRALAHTTGRDRRLELFSRLGDLHDRLHNHETALGYYAQALDTGLPWYLRGTLPQWAATVLFAGLSLLAGPATAIPVGAWVLRRLPRRRREALHHCALAAGLRAAILGRIGVCLRFGTTVVLTGLAGYGKAPGPSFGVAVGGMQFLAALLGLERAFSAWLALDSEWQQDRRTSDQHRIGIHMTRGTAALFLACEADCLRALEQAFQTAEARKDARLMELAGFTLITAYRLFSRHDQAMALVQKLLRFAKAEHIGSVEATAIFFEALCEFDRENYARTLQLFDELRSRTDLRDAHDLLTSDQARFFDLACRYQSAGPSEALARQLVDLLDVADRQAAMVPVYSLSAFVFTLAAEVCAQLRLRGRLPADVAARLARARRRWRVIGRRGRWREGKWLVGLSIYDAMQGKTRRAQRELERGLALLGRHDNHYTLRQCRAGQRGFAPGSELAARCTTALEELYARRPDLRPPDRSNGA
jgi:tetratricopeptide (TPR) repeat protein